MAQRAFSLRYHIAKMQQAIDVVTQLASAGAGMQEAVAKGLEAYTQRLTSVVLLAGVAMSPTFNNPKRAKGREDPVEHLLLRHIPRPSAKNIYTGDVVAFTRQFAGEPEASVMVRRVAAVEGDELGATDESSEGVEAEYTYRIPRGHCWVLADNEELGGAPLVIDSRAFGPLPFESILGRVVYSAASESDHGPVENSDQALEADAPVLEAELDIEVLCRWGEAGEEEEEEQR